MYTVKTRKVGNSLAITFPKELNIEEGERVHHLQRGG